MPDNDFTRGQHGYDLELEIDPTSNDIIYVGGINWHRSQNGGTSWSQISKWTTPWYGYGALNTSIVHADMHGLYFRPGSPTQQWLLVMVEFLTLLAYLLLLIQQILSTTREE